MLSYSGSYSHFVLNGIAYLPINETKVRVLDVESSETETLRIPEMVNGYIVSEIDMYIGTPNNVTVIEIPLSIEEIKERAFQMQSRLKKVHFYAPEILSANDTIQFSREMFYGCEHLEEISAEIETNLEEDVKMTTDGELLSLVWNNLFSNAFKFTPNGGKVALVLETTEYDVVVKITDNGCGMSPEVGAHIFEKFYQGDTSHASAGNGLGLALVKKVIDILGGEIAVQSEVNKGSKFEIILPIYTVENSFENVQISDLKEIVKLEMSDIDTK